MISELMAIALLSLPCNSQVVHANSVTTVSMCPMPLIQGPPRPPLGWGKVDKTHKAAEVKKPVKAKPKKKKRKKRKR